MGGLLSLAGAALVAAGVVLPWLSVGSEPVSGWDASDDAKILVGAAVVLALLGAVLVGGARSLVLRVLLLLVGAAVIGLGAFEILSVMNLDDRFDATVGIGLPVLMCGGFVALVGALLTRHRRLRVAG